MILGEEESQNKEMPVIEKRDKESVNFIRYPLNENKPPIDINDVFYKHIDLEKFMKIRMNRFITEIGFDNASQECYQSKYGLD